MLKAMPLNPDEITTEEREEFAEVHWNALHNLPGPHSMNRDPSPRELWYHRRLFLPATAIYKSYEILLDLECYVCRFPYRNTRVSPAGHLRHNIEAYFQEAYILRQRMIDFLNSLEKDYAGSAEGETLQRINQPLCKILKTGLRSIMEARKTHVHGGGYDDENLKRLDTWELLARYTPKKQTDEHIDSKSLFQLHYRKSYRRERARWAKLVKDWNSVIEKLLNHYFESLMKILFDQDGHLVTPPFSRK